MGSTIETAATPRRRMLGWDLWRFWGCFVIFLGHNYGLWFDYLLDGSMVPSTLLQEFYYRGQRRHLCIPRCRCS